MKIRLDEKYAAYGALVLFVILVAVNWTTIVGRPKPAKITLAEYNSATNAFEQACKLAEMATWRLRTLDDAWIEKWNRAMAEPNFYAGVRYGVLAHCKLPQETNVQTLVLAASNIWWPHWHEMTNAHVITNDWPWFTARELEHRQ